MSAQAAAPAPRSRRWRRRPSARSRIAADRRLGYAMVAPVIVLLLAVIAYPLFYNLWNSFHHVNLSEANAAQPFVGVESCSRMFAIRKPGRCPRAHRGLHGGVSRDRDWSASGRRTSRMRRSCQPQ